MYPPSLVCDSVQITVYTAGDLPFGLGHLYAGLGSWSLHSWRPPIVAPLDEIATPRGYLKPYLDTILVCCKDLKFSDE